MKRIFTILLLVALTLCFSAAAQAAAFTFTVPDKRGIETIVPQSDGSLIVVTYGELLRVDPATQTTTTMPSVNLDALGFGYTLALSDTGDLYATTISDENDAAHIHHYDPVTETWTQVGTVESSTMLYNAQCGRCFQGVYYWTISQDGRPALLVSYDPATGETTTIGDIGALYGSATLNVMGDKLVILDYDYEQEQQYLYYYDPATKAITREKVTLPDSICLDYLTTGADGTLWVLGTKQEDYSSALYSGTSLEQLSLIASGPNANALVAMGDDCLLVTWLNAYSYHILSDATCNLVLNDFSTEHDIDFTMQYGITLSHVYQDVATMLNTQSSDVDIFLIRSDMAPGLKIIKDKGFYVDLSGSETLNQRADRLFRSLSKPIRTDDGKLVAWPVSIDPMFFEAWFFMADDYDLPDLPQPATYGEILDQIALMQEAGVFDSGAISPFDLFDYDQRSLMIEVMKRFIVEQTVLDKPIDFDNEELRALLARILAEVPREANAPTGDEAEMVESIYITAIGYSPLPDNVTMPPAIGASSPQALDGIYGYAVVNPYSKHQAEAIAYLEYIAAQDTDLDYMLYADLTDPLPNTQNQQRLQELDAQLAELQALDPTAEVKEHIEALQDERAILEQNLYLISQEAIDTWHAVAESMAVQEEPSCVYSDQIQKLITRLVDGGMALDDFIKGCNQYITMVYEEAR